MMKRWFSGITKTSLRFKEAASFRVFAARLEGFGTGLFIRVLRNSVFAASTCVFALGGALVGSIIGAMKGQTTETGFLRGSGVGAVAGAITAVQLLESITNGEPLSKVALLHSLLNGKVFIEWVGPALLKAYQWQVSRSVQFAYQYFLEYIIESIMGFTSQNVNTCKFLRLLH
ncbi:hypothetical protein OIU77_015427 [Salix suchowensis]|uniref:Uncharacterized protein n=1 Tax=Salix suchowensis TaxID=1278906 RepID=A0ABQ8ZH54_9ROSI|nr:hypothetical protein OIU77_015427 [Salix suchowensis]